MISWMRAAHIEEVLAIELRCYTNAWTLGEFRSAVDNLSCKIVTIKGRIAGYLIYEVKDDYTEVLNLCVDVHQRRHGVGRDLISDVQCRFSRIHMMIIETNIGGLNFLKKVGFKSDGKLYKGYFPSVPDLDAIKMEWRA